MGKVYSPDVVPEIGVLLPSGRFLFSIVEMDDSEPTSNNNYQIKAQLAVVEPASMAGSPHWEYFVIGNTDDPNADDPESWKGYAAGRYKQLLKKAGVEMSGDVEQDTASAVGQQVGGQIQQEIEPPTRSIGGVEQVNPYAGRVRSRIVAFFRPGERDTGIDAQNGVGQRSAVPAKPQAAPKATAPAPKPVAKAPAPAPAKPVAKPAPKAAQLLACPMCSEKVARDQFGAHVAGHEGGETAEEE